MNYIIDEKFIITDKDKVEERISSMVGASITMEEIEDFIMNEECTIFYIDDKLRRVAPEDAKDINSVWLDTGLLDARQNAIFISLINLNNGYFEGFFVGDAYTLSKVLVNYFPKNTSAINENLKKFNAKYLQKLEKRTIKHLSVKDGAIIKDTVEDNASVTPARTANINNVTEEIFSQLLCKTWRSISGLDRYIKIIGCRIKTLIAQEATDYYVMNNIKSVVVNTGLLNTLGSDFHILYRINLSEGTYSPYKVIYSKSQYLEENFTKEQATKYIKPISFIDDNAEFNADISDFDLDYYDMIHIIQERRDRFPESVNTLSDNVLTQRLQSALERGLKMQRRDRSYIKPYYSTHHGISWVMPFYINEDLVNDPELVMVISKDDYGDSDNNNDFFYKIKTILPYNDTMKDNIAVTSLYSGIW